MKAGLINLINAAKVYSTKRKTGPGDAFTLKNGEASTVVNGTILKVEVEDMLDFTLVAGETIWSVNTLTRYYVDGKRVRRNEISRMLK